jgi:hypothetical protein
MVWVVDLSRRETFNCGSLKPELTTFRYPSRSQFPILDEPQHRFPADA